MNSYHKIIISISSDIGFYLAKDWLNNGIRVSGTYRTKTDQCEEWTRRSFLSGLIFDLLDSYTFWNEIN
jgi:GDP-D-mannose dehydratase